MLFLPTLLSAEPICSDWKRNKPFLISSPILTHFHSHSSPIPTTFLSRMQKWTCNRQLLQQEVLTFTSSHCKTPILLVIKGKSDSEENQVWFVRDWWALSERGHKVPISKLQWMKSAPTYLRRSSGHSKIYPQTPWVNCLSLSPKQKSSYVNLQGQLATATNGVLFSLPLLKLYMPLPRCYSEVIFSFLVDLLLK